MIALYVVTNGFVKSFFGSFVPCFVYARHALHGDFLSILPFHRLYACVWFFLHAVVERAGDNTWAIHDGLATFNQSSGQHNIMDSEVSPLHCLLRSWYFTLSTMSSVGYGDIVPRNNTETGFQMLVVITGLYAVPLLNSCSATLLVVLADQWCNRVLSPSGACLFAALVGCIGVLLKEEDRKTDLEFRRKKAQLQNYFRTKNLPQNLVRTIEANFVAMWKTRVDLNHQSESDGALLEAASSTEAQRTDSAIYVDKQYQKRLLRELPIGLRADIAFAAKRGEGLLLFFARTKHDLLLRCNDLKHTCRFESELICQYSLRFADVVQTIHYLRSLDEVAQRLIALELQVMYCYSNTILYQRGDQVLLAMMGNFHLIGITADAPH